MNEGQMAELAARVAAFKEQHAILFDGRKHDDIDEVIHRLAGIIGIDPGRFTLAELMVMADEKLLREKERHAEILEALAPKASTPSALTSKPPRTVGETIPSAALPPNRLLDLPALDDEDIAILRALAACAPQLCTLYQIEADTRITRKTVGTRLARLIELRLAHRPKGERGGATITPAGAALLEKTPRPKITR